MSLYYEAAEVLTAPNNAGGSLKSRIFTKKDLKSQPAQIYALVIETCKWSSILKEVIEHASLQTLERKLTPVLSLLLVHDLLLAKRGISLPTTHGLRALIERHKARLQAEFTKARIRRGLSSVEALKEYVESDGDTASESTEAPHPRWIRINTLRTRLEDQLETTFAGYERAYTITAVRRRGIKSLYIDPHIPNLVAVPATADLTKSNAYSSGAIIFQDKASCFPAYLLDPLPQDGDIVDTCAAPGNKTTHIAAIMQSHLQDPEDCRQRIHAFEKNKIRAETLNKMVKLADSEKYTHVHAGQDFLKVDPNSPSYKNVGALLLDPSCSGSGIVGRDDMPELHLPSMSTAPPSSTNPRGKSKGKRLKPEEPRKDALKRKHQGEEALVETMVDDDGLETAVTSGEELQNRLQALSAFQLTLLLHAMKFPAARKITYSTCSIHAEENEVVVLKALSSSIAQERGWRLLMRNSQVRGMQDWPVRGSREACTENEEVAEGCIRAHKGDEFGTMGFFLAGFVRDISADDAARAEAWIVRDENGHIVRDIMGNPVTNDLSNSVSEVPENGANAGISEGEEEEWGGFDDTPQVAEPPPVPKSDKGAQQLSRPRQSLLSGMSAAKRKKKSGKSK